MEKQLSKKESPKQQLLHISFNQDQSYLAIGTESGFKVFKCNPLKQVFSRSFGAGIGIVEMIYSTNIVAIVGGGKTPRYPRNKVMIWDDTLMKCIIETNCKSEVKALKLKANRCVVVLQTKVFVFNLSDFRVLELLETCPNPKGLCSIANDSEQLILALPNKKVGIVEVSFQNLNQRVKIDAHKSTLCALELCPSGIKLATASEKGTIIRIFDVESAQCIQELRRGSEYATIYSLAFDSKSRWLACSSDSGTVHIFAIKAVQKEIVADQQTKNKKSNLAFLKVFTSYFDSEWSFAQFKTPVKKTKVGFLNQANTHTLAIASTEFDPEKGGECVQKRVYDLHTDSQIKEQQSKS